jgi:hypothetical protein
VIRRNTDSWGFLFGLVNERIGDLRSLRIGKGIIGRNHVFEMLVLRILAMATPIRPAQ